MAVVDLFHTHASRVDGEEVLDPAQLKALLGAIGERPSDAELARLFELADLDSNGTIDLSEFLAAADQVLGGSPARYVLVVGGPGSGKGVLCERLVRECGVGHVSCGELLRDEVRADTPLGRDCDAIMRRGGLVPSVVITMPAGGRAPSAAAGCCSTASRARRRTRSTLSASAASPSSRCS